MLDKNLTLGTQGQETLGQHLLLQKLLRQKKLPWTAQHQHQRSLQIDAGAKELDGKTDHAQSLGHQAVDKREEPMIRDRIRNHLKDDNCSKMVAITDF